MLYETPASEEFAAEVLESGETIPTLDEAMEVVPANVGVNIDIEEGSPDVQFGRVDDPEAEREGVDVARVGCRDRDQLRQRVVVLDVLGGRARDRPRHRSRSAGSVPALRLHSGGLDVTDEYDTDAVNPPLEKIYGTPLFDGDAYEEIDLVAEAHERDLPVTVWTINTWYEVERLIDAGVDGLFLDYSESVRYLLGRRIATPRRGCSRTIRFSEYRTGRKGETTAGGALDAGAGGRRAGEGGCRSNDVAGCLAVGSAVPPSISSGGRVKSFIPKYVGEPLVVPFRQSIVRSTRRRKYSRYRLRDPPIRPPFRRRRPGSRRDRRGDDSPCSCLSPCRPTCAPGR
ncbi:glycerophosphodiester phosphodiesterase [Natronococcus wangiae]|uniref:glycerophosphodiester phosphodiesterase n=1 Tax=Natronococcus wangiae TaxID=3068275 RepID=UPI00273DAD3F|nr:glycerophosphodiester phosphodiesterase [Natronococcus sp. AD5]